MNAFVVPKGSEWKIPISKKILKYIEEDTMAKLNIKWLGDSCHSSKAALENEMYSLEDFGGLFVIVLGCMIFLLLIAICLFAIRKCKGNLRCRKSQEESL